MTHFNTQATAAQSTPAAARQAAPATLPRRGRLGAAIASVLVTTLVIGSVVVGMTDMATDGTQMAVVATSAQLA